jgi:hypothetical protein
MVLQPDWLMGPTFMWRGTYFATLATSRSIIAMHLKSQRHRYYLWCVEKKIHATNIMTPISRFLLVLDKWDNLI